MSVCVRRLVCLCVISQAGPDCQFFGYGYQWWLCPRDSDQHGLAGDFMAIGIYNQFLYVSPEDGIVIVKNSANPGYGQSEVADLEVEEKTMFALRAMCRALRHL